MSAICKCDFCTGIKKLDGTWCSRCGEKVEVPSPVDDMAVCEECDEAIRKELAK